MYNIKDDTTMANRTPKPSDLNIEGMMDDIDKLESIQNETVNLDRQLEKDFGCHQEAGRTLQSIDKLDKIETT